MGCFAVQKAKKILGERAAGLNEVTTTESESASTSEAPFSPSSSKSSGLSPVRRFRRTVKTIQNAQKFISHSKSGPRSANHVHGLDSPEQGVSPGHMNYGSQPMPLPSPRPRLNPTRYVLPHPFEQVDSNIASPKSTEASHASLHSRIFPYELQPLPLPKAASTTVPRGLKSFTFDELADACQNFSDEALVDDDGVFFHGSIHTCSNGSDANRQKVVVLHLDDKLHLGLKDWLPELYPSDHPPSAFICKLVGFHDACTTERLLVYEYLARGSLYSLLFNTSGASSLDWPARIKIIHGAVEGLVSLEERFPDNVRVKKYSNLLNCLLFSVVCFNAVEMICFFWKHRESEFEASKLLMSSQGR
ncbi:hypothetical protein KP509_35G063500 [Ceratopteris richardii]|uniref:Protein kinase domain-containing protein n=1 Tax=Ceratopteris richardii TaxID=49495 RepID=A0A8T2QHR5_CERRI|nr:hypothetical protein KP509_35G063500 [Ceratopteris richardii]